MIRGVWLISLLLFLDAPARADDDVDYSGTWTITNGVAPDKSEYAGTVVLERLGGDEPGEIETYTASWSDEPRSTYLAVGWDLGDRFIAAFGEATSVGVLGFGKTASGKLAITVEVSGSSADVQRFYLTGKKLKKGKFAGTWSMLDERGRVVGKVKIKKKRKVYDLTVSLPNGESSKGVAIAVGKKLHFATAEPGVFGVVTYQVKSTSTGLRLVGKWAFGNGNGKLGTETLVGPTP